MAVELADLVPRLRNSLNPPGVDFFQATNGQYEEALVNGFWQARLQHLFVDYRVNDANQVVPIDSTDADLAEELHQLIVLFTVMVVLKAKILSLPTLKRNQAGPVETEIRRSAEVLNKLLDDSRTELDRIREDLADNPNAGSYIAVIDGVRARTCAMMDDYTDWVA